MKKIGGILLLFFLAIPSFGQRLGIVAGYTLTNTLAKIDYSKKVVNFDKTPTSGFAVGPIFSWDFFKNFGADIAILANMRGANFKIQSEGVIPTAFKQTFYYLDIPLHAYYKVSINDVSLTFFAGPSFNIGLSGSNYAYEFTTLEKPIFNSQLDKKELFGKDNSYKRFEIGIDIGIGVEYKNILFRTNWMQGVNNITQNRSYPYGLSDFGAGIKQIYRQGVFSFCVGYVFNLKQDNNKTYTK